MGEASVGKVKMAESHSGHLVPHIFFWEEGGREIFLVGNFNSWARIPVDTPLGLVYILNICVDRIGDI